MLPVFLSYVLSFVYLGIYWNNHHHMLATVDRVSGGMLWANLHLLFWLSLVPFVTGWMGATSSPPCRPPSTASVLLMAAIAYFVLQRLIIASQGEGSLLAKAIGRDLKGKVVADASTSWPSPRRSWRRGWPAPSTRWWRSSG